jgi:hypothetical protein
MIRKSRFAIALVSAGMISGAPPSEAAGPAALGIAWDTARAAAHGNGCNSQKGDTVFVAFGPDLSVLFRNFDIKLKKGDRGPLNVVRQCQLRVPAQIPGGVYKSQLTQTVIYGVNKSQNTDGAITVSSSFFDKPIRQLEHQIRRGLLQAPYATSTKVTDLLMLNACTGRALTGLYRSTVTVSARRDTANEDIIVATAGLDLRYDITNVITPCP